jgi:hypothetical protein
MRRSKTIIRACSGGLRGDATVDMRSATSETGAIGPNGLGVCPDMIPSTTTELANMSAKLDRNASQLWA